MLKHFARLFATRTGTKATRSICCVANCTLYYNSEPPRRQFVDVNGRKKTMDCEGSRRFYISKSTGDGGVQVKHDTKANLFYIDVPKLGRAFLEYEHHGQLVKILHTQVPEKLEGRGLGKILAKAALDYVIKNDLHAEIECDFVKNYVKKYEPGFIKYMKN